MGGDKMSTSKEKETGKRFGHRSRKAIFLVFAFLLALPAMTGGNIANAASDASSWTLVDDGELIKDRSKSLYNTDLIEYNGDLYVLWSEDADLNVLMHAMKYDGRDWASVDEPQTGCPAGCLNAYGNENRFANKAVFPSLAVYKGKLYASWYEGYLTFDYRARVRQFDGTNWTTVDGGTLNMAPGLSWDPRITVFNDELYAIWQEGSQIQVKKYDDTGAEWQVASPTPSLSGSGAGSPQLAVYDGSLYAVWREESGTQGVQKIKVSRYVGGRDWESIDGGGFGSDVDTYINHPNVAVFGDKMYVAWSDNNKAIRVKSYDEENGWQWADDNAGLNYTAGSNVSVPKLIAYDGLLYAAWVESNTVRAKKYDGISWTSADSDHGLNARDNSTANHPSLAVYGGKLFAAWTEKYDGKNQVRVAKMPVLEAPDAPQFVTAVEGDGEATVNFYPPASNGGSPIVRYEVADAAGRMVAAGAGSPIAVTGLENGTAYAFTVTAVNVAGPGLPSALSNEVTPRAASNGGNPGGGEGGGNGGNGGNVGGGGGGGSSAPQTPAESKENPAASVQVWVNGQVASLGATAKERLGDREATLLVVDSVLLERVLSASEGANATLKVAGRSAGGLVVALDAQALRMLQQRHATVELDIGTGIYPVPVEAIDLADVMRRLGGAAVQTGFSLRIEAFLPAEAAQERLAKTAAAERLELRGSPVEFAIRAVQGAKSVPISRFNGYVERLIALPDGAAGAGISTGVVMDDNGNLRHAPTKLIKRDGKQYARISSLTNSVYALVSRPVHFSDMAGHWAEEDIAEMSARLVINGEKGTFGPDRPVTRAEFAAMLVRALGLPQAEGTTIPFADVNPGVWYADTVHTAYVYGMIGGFEDGTFRPTARMTREQALVMIARAMSLTGLKTDVATGTKASLPFAAAAEVSAYARSGVAAATQAGIASGAKDGRLAPKAQITRAEVAALLKRLLEKSDLI